MHPRTRCSLTLCNWRLTEASGTESLDTDMFNVGVKDLQKQTSTQPDYLSIYLLVCLFSLFVYLENKSIQFFKNVFFLHANGNLNWRQNTRPARNIDIVGLSHDAAIQKINKIKIYL